MHIFLETERLILRRFTEDDVDNLYALDGDPAVMRAITTRAAAAIPAQSTFAVAPAAQEMGRR